VPRAVSYFPNPFDNVLLASHEVLRRRGYCGLPVMLIADVSGALAPTEMAEAVRELGRRYPALSAHIRCTAVWGRAYWHVPADAALEDAVEYEHHAFAGAPAEPWEPLRRTLDDAIDPFSGPQLRLVHVDLGEGRHRLGLRWAHPLMDLEGGHLLLGELDAILQGRPPTLGQDPRTMHKRPFKWSFPKSLLRVWQGRIDYAKHDRVHQPRIVGRPACEDKRFNFLVREFDATRRKAFESAAKQRCTPGPMLYARAVIVGAARTYVSMASEGGRPRDRYLFSLAVPHARGGPRPGVHGNYVTKPWIELRASDVKDWDTADAAVTRQLRAYVADSHDEAMYEMCRAALRWPLAMTRRLITHRHPRGALCTTGYRFGASPLALGQAQVTNLCAVGAVYCHPGWISCLTMYADRMALTLSFLEDYIDAATARTFLHRVEREILGTS
jgi:hypothetical protein